MANQENSLLSPTVIKVLDECLTALHSDGDIDNDAADRLDILLRKGNAPKPEEIDAALILTENVDKP